MAERSIDGADLMGRLPEVLEEIAQGTVFLVSMGKVPESSGVISGLVSAAEEIVFALGSPQALAGVFIEESRARVAWLINGQPVKIG